jgi:hypothetical protein
MLASPTPNINEMLPTMIEYLPDNTIIMRTSASTIPATQADLTPNLWQHVPIPPAFENTHPFFQHLLSCPPTKAEYQDIAQELSEEQLVACCDGAHYKLTSIASHGWVFSSTLMRTPIATGAGPINGHPQLLSYYRAELSGIVAVLFIIQRISHYYEVRRWKCTTYCDNKAALNKTFNLIEPGITPYMTPDHNLLELANNLL